MIPHFKEAIKAGYPKWVQAGMVITLILMIAHAIRLFHWADYPLLGLAQVLFIGVMFYYSFKAIDKARK